MESGLLLHFENMGRICNKGSLDHPDERGRRFVCGAAAYDHNQGAAFEINTIKTPEEWITISSSR
jgi:hypothetical protein